MQKIHLLQKNQCYVLIVAVYSFRTTSKKWLLLSAQVNYNSHYRTALENIALKDDVLVLNRCLKDDQIYSRCDGQLLYKYPEILQVSIGGASFKILVKRIRSFRSQAHIYSNCGGMQCPHASKTTSSLPVLKNMAKFIEGSKSSTHYLSDTNRFDVSSKGPSSGISVGGRGKHACFYTSEYTKTTRDKIKTNQMDLIKTRNK